MENKQFALLSEDELEGVSGGLQMMASGRVQITTCENFVCCWCGLGKSVLGEESHGCKAQGHGYTRAPDGTEVFIDATFANTCEWCEHRYTCSLA